MCGREGGCRRQHLQTGALAEEPADHLDELKRHDEAVIDLVIDRKGVIHKGRTDLDQWKSAHAIETKARTLQEALEGAAPEPIAVVG